MLLLRPVEMGRKYPSQTDRLGDFPEIIYRESLLLLSNGNHNNCLPLDMKLITTQIPRQQARV